MAGPRPQRSDAFAYPIDQKRCGEQPSESAQEELGLCQQHQSRTDGSSAAEIGGTPDTLVVGAKYLEHLPNTADNEKDADQQERDRSREKWGHAGKTSHDQ